MSSEDSVGGLLMPAAGSCQVCEHPERVAIEAALRAGHPAVRTVASQHGLKDKNVLLRHRKNHMKGPVRTREELVQAKIAAAAQEQIARGAEVIIEQQRETAAELNRANQAFRMTVRKITMDLVAALAGRQHDPDAPIELGKARTLIEALRVAVQASDSIEGGIELGGKLTGELASGNQVNVQVNVLLQEHVERLGVASGDWIAQDLPPAIRAGLQESGIGGDLLERATMTVGQRVAGARDALAARVERAVDEAASNDGRNA